MRTPDYRKDMMPYGMAKNADGSWTFFNRNYKTIGTVTDSWSEWDDPKHKLKFKGLGPAKLKRLDCHGKGTGDRIYFYDDGCVPTHSAANMKAYLARIEILMNLKTEG